MKQMIRHAGVLTALLLVLAMLPGLEVAAQGTLMPIPAHGSVYTGYSRGFWFTAPTSFFITGVRVPTDASTADQNVFLVRFAAPPPGLPGTSTYTVLGQWYNIPGTNVIPCQILVNSGDFIGVIGHRCVLPATNFNAINSYTSTGPAASNILGVPVDLYRLMYQDNIVNIVPGLLGSAATGQLGRVELYVAPPCVIPEGSLTAALTDAFGNPKNYVEAPGSIHLQYQVSYPAGASNVGITAVFTRIGETVPAFTVTLNDVKAAGSTLLSRQAISLPANVPPGYYTVTVTFSTLNSCGNYEDTELEPLSLMIVRPGTQLCRVWPGDVNNDDVVNYADRKDLNRYIFDANLRSSWLTGPARFRTDAATNPLVFYNWEEQPAIPWDTPEGCYMDADGNGVVNNFDYIAIKLNWLKLRPGSPAKRGEGFSAASFDIDQNHPNPFSEGTAIRFHLPEASMTQLVVVDMLGRTVATLVDGRVEAGTRFAHFSGEGLPAGKYVLRFTSVGSESGLRFAKTITMALVK